MYLNLYWINIATQQSILSINYKKKKIMHVNLHWI